MISRMKNAGCTMKGEIEEQLQFPSEGTVF